MPASLGVASAGARGFPCVNFEDSYGEKCVLSCSSLIGGYEDSMDRPGTSAVWLGLEKASAQVMARDAAKVGVMTSQSTGWVPYPIPEGVMVSAAMHLDREQVAGLIARLQQWLGSGTFQGVVDNSQD